VPSAAASRRTSDPGEGSRVPVSRRVAWAFALGFELLLAGTGANSIAVPPSPLVPTSEQVGGRDYGQWLATAYQWRLSLPAVTAQKASCFTSSQQGPVWFLSGSLYNGTGITRRCQVPAGRYLMTFTPSFDCSTVERPPLHATTDAGLRRCAKALWRKYPGSERLTLDGVRLLPSGYVVATDAFHFKMPARNNWLNVPGRTRGRAAAYGLASILRPLSPGVHTLVHVEPPFAHIPGRTSTTTYQITVK
jgi:hypothetical protein